MPSQFIRKLEQFVDLNAEDKRVLSDIVSERSRVVAAREDLIREGDDPIYMYVMLSGWSFRYKMLEDGRRQIIAFFLPGDLCDLNVFLLPEMDHSIAALTPLRVAEISREQFNRIERDYPNVMHALWWESLVAFAIQREWTVSLGQRDAIERISHLLCELYFRQDAVGLVDNKSCELPVTQSEFASAAGLSAVHVNRTLQELRALGVIEFHNKVLTVPDIDALTRVAGFNPSYLHLKPRD